MADPEVVAVVSAYNEEDRVASTVRALRTLPVISRIIVVNDASQDDTAREAAEAHAEVISLDRNRGKGGALNFVLSRLSFDILLLVDADLGESAIEADKLLKPVLEGKADMTIANFPEAKVPGGFGLVKSLAYRAIRHFTGLLMGEPLSGQRALKREVWKTVGRLDKGFGVEVGLTIDAARAGYRVREVPTQMTHRETGRDIGSILHRARQFFDVLKVVLKRM